MATSTPIPTLIPTSTPTPNPWAISDSLRMENNVPGEIRVTWYPPVDSPVDYRISWAQTDEDWKTWTDLSGNAFPTSPSYLIQGLEEGVKYKITVRARYDGNSGPWTEVVTITTFVMEPTATPTTTLEIVLPTATSTPTATPTPEIVLPVVTSIPTATPTPTVVQSEVPVHKY